MHLRLATCFLPPVMYLTSWAAVAKPCASQSFTRRSSFFLQETRGVLGASPVTNQGMNPTTTCTLVECWNRLPPLGPAAPVIFPISHGGEIGPEKHWQAVPAYSGGLAHTLLSSRAFRASMAGNGSPWTLLTFLCGVVKTSETAWTAEKPPLWNLYGQAYIEDPRCARVRWTYSRSASKCRWQQCHTAWHPGAHPLITKRLGNRPS